LERALTDLAIEITGLNAWYGESHVLHGVDLRVPQGQTIALLGRNGAGKTTTLKSIMGIIEKRTGTVMVKGRDMLRVPLHRVAKLGLGYVPEERGIFSSLNVFENLRLLPIVSERSMADAEIFSLFPNLEERSTSPGTKLSGGEQQMLAIARVLRSGAEILLLDEPTEGLAPVIVQRIAELLKLLRQRGLTILLVEQNFRFARHVADGFAMMEDGKIIEQFTREELPERSEAIQQVLGV
jgi:branched-chain amino acid transport system ATP-binding protein